MFCNLTITKRPISSLKACPHNARKHSRKQIDQIARSIVQAIEHRRSIAYLPWFWWGIMQVIKHIPESIFRRLKL